MIPASTLALPMAIDLPGIRWFARNACVVEREGVCEVFVGGLLIGRFGRRDRGVRNAIVVQLAADRHVHLQHLADAFGISVDTLRLIRRQFEAEGMAR